MYLPLPALLLDSSSGRPDPDPRVTAAAVALSERRDPRGCQSPWPPPAAGPRGPRVPHRGAGRRSPSPLRPPAPRDLSQFHPREICPLRSPCPNPHRAPIHPLKSGLRNPPAMVVCKCRKVTHSLSADLPIPAPYPTVSRVVFVLVSRQHTGRFGIWGVR